MSNDDRAFDELVERLTRETEKRFAANRDAEEWEATANQYYDKCKEQQAEIERLKPQWISVDDRLPETAEGLGAAYHTVEVIAFNGDKVFTAELQSGTTLESWHKFYSNLNEEYTDDVTHWMPLPEPPQ